MKNNIFYAFLYGEFQDTTEANNVDEAKDNLKAKNIQETDYDILLCYSRISGNYRVFKNL